MRNCMLGAIIGDTAGSRFEWKNHKNFTLDGIRESYTFDVSCQGSVPQAFAAFFESTGFEDAIRNAVSIGGDSDTIALIAGGMAGAYYGVPNELREREMLFMDKRQREILDAFEVRYESVEASDTACT
jgi:ADP-ribosylglycohydrolase